MVWLWLVLKITLPEAFFWGKPLNFTGWRRLIGCLKLQVISHKRATDYGALLRKMTYKDKASYVSSPPCIQWWLYWFVHLLSMRHVHDMNELQRVAVCCSDSTLNYERVVLGICPVPYTYACVCIDHRQRRSDLKIIITAQFSNKQIFTGVPVHIKHVFTGVPRFSYTFLLVKTESPSLKGFDEKVVRSRNPNMSGLISSVSVSVLWGGYD